MLYPRRQGNNLRQRDIIDVSQQCENRYPELEKPTLSFLSPGPLAAPASQPRQHLSPSLQPH